MKPSLPRVAVFNIFVLKILGWFFFLRFGKVKCLRKRFVFPQCKCLCQVLIEGLIHRIVFSILSSKIAIIICNRLYLIFKTILLTFLASYFSLMVQIYHHHHHRYFNMQVSILAWVRWSMLRQIFY